MTSKLSTYAVILLFALFAVSRFFDLAARPLHNDEGVNAWFLQNLVVQHKYKYDPSNYHGPSLYYLQLIPTWMTTLKVEGFRKFHGAAKAGITPTSIRAMVAFAGLVVLLGFLAAKNRIGAMGALAAFFLAGVSPDILFYSRYFIHEIYVVLFTLGIYLGLAYFADTKKRVYFYLACLSTALLFATKETFAVIFLVMALANDLTKLTLYVLTPEKKEDFATTMGKDLRLFWQENRWHLLGGAALMLAVWFLLFSSFFTNYKGLLDSVVAYAVWSGTGMESGHNKPFYYFIKDLLLPYESPIVLLSLVGLWFSFYLKDRKGIFISFWALGLLAAHSLIPYKTPWLVITLLLPMTLLAGYGVQQWINFYQSGPRSIRFKVLSGALSLIILGLLMRQIPQAVKINYIEYDNEKHKQVYVHTSRDIMRLAQDIDDMTAGLPHGRDVSIHIYAAVQWPLPFYLRNYTHTAWWGDKAAIKDAPIVIAGAAQAEQMAKELKMKYRSTKYTLRPGVDLLVYIDDDFFNNERRTVGN